MRKAKIVDNVKPPADAKEVITAYAKLRNKADEDDRAAAAARRAVRVLRGRRLT